MKTAFHESTPLRVEDCLLVFVRHNKEFDFPIHFHLEYELNFIMNAAGAIRVVGENHELIGETELVLLGPNVIHGWEQGGRDVHKDVTEITIQFHRDLLASTLLQKNALREIKVLLHNAYRGILFSEHAVQKVLPLLHKISQNSGFQSFLTLLEILAILAQESSYRILSEEEVGFYDVQNQRIQKVYEYVEQNFHKKLKLEDAAEHLNMTIISFSRLMKNRTGKTFVDFLNDYRINYAIRMLMDSSALVTEIAEHCGFSNQANFNRIFKQRTGFSPSEYKRQVTNTTRVN